VTVRGTRPVRVALAVAGAAALGLALSAQPGEARQDGPGAAVTGAALLPGYLPRTSLPDSLALLPPPPAAGSAAFARDEEARESAAPLRGSARWDRAAGDAVLAFPQAVETFACAAGVAIGEDDTPRLYRLMRTMMVDVGLSTYAAKDHYRRDRPFVARGGPTCSPTDEAALRGDGSYPSGHSALGWGWALALAEIAPERADAILQRGREFGQSRLVCNVHWQSDIDAGRVIAAAAVARLHADADFRADLKAARREVERARRAGRLPRGDCAAEAASLAQP